MKFCRQCAEYIAEHFKECPNCGHVFAGQAEKPRYFCKRCKRELLSRICPIHGVESTVQLNSSSASAEKPGKTKNPAGGENPSVFPGKTLRSLPESKSSAPLPPKPGDAGAAQPVAAPKRDSAARPASASKEIPVADSVYYPQTAKTEVDSSGKAAAGSQPIEPALNFSASRQPSAKTVAEEKRPGPQMPNEQENAPGGAKTPKAKNPAPNGKQTRPQQAKNNPPASGSLKGKAPSWIYWGTLTAVLIAAAITVYAHYYPVYLRNSLYSRAEGFFNEGHHDAALQLYREYKLRYPADSAIPYINERINQIQQGENEFTKKQIKIFSTMQKAAEAYNNNNYLEPREESAVFYISEILREDPEFIPALELQNRVVDYYLEQAETAFDKDLYDKAVAYYENLLTIKPEDPQFKNAYERALKLKYVYGMLDDMSALAEAKEELKNLQKEKYKLKMQIQQERRKLKENSREMETRKNDASGKSTVSDKKSSNQVLLDGNAVAAGMAFSNKRNPAVDNGFMANMPGENSFAKDDTANQNLAPETQKYHLEPAPSVEPVQFNTKKKVKND